MDKNKSNSSQLHDEQNAPWWNRPLVGDKSMGERLKNLLNQSGGAFSKKEEIPDQSVKLYQDYFSQVKTLGAIAKTIDDIKFTGGEFSKLITVNREIKNDTGDYKGLKHPTELLTAALQTKDSFLKVEATETRYRGYAQQEYYEYIYDLLEKKVEGEEFKTLAHQELEKILPQIKTEEGKTAIQSYVTQLDTLADNELGLQLLFLFKQYDLSDFALLRSVAEIADSFYDKNLDVIKEFMSVVQVHVDLFVRLGQIIEVPTAKNLPETYAAMLQYVALMNRHGRSFGQFKQLIQLLEDWEKLYNPLVAIRQEYPPDEYQQPKIFEEDIVGLPIYQKYIKHLHKI